MRKRAQGEKHRAIRRRENGTRNRHKEKGARRRE